MNDRAHRKELVAHYKQTPPDAGVYRFVNQRNHKSLLGSTLNLASMRNKLEFARSTNTFSALDRRLSQDLQEFGLDAFSFEVLEVLEINPGMTQAEMKADLAMLEELWREKLAPEPMY
jgi:hypothetical protein